MPGGAFGDARLKELVKWQRGIGDRGTQMHVQLHDGGEAVVSGMETCGQGCQEVHLGMQGSRSW